MRQKIEKPWGYEEIIVHTDRYAMKKIFIKAEHRLSKQFHIEKEKTIHVLGGILYLDLSREAGESNIRKLYEGESWHIQPKTIHRFCAPADTNLILIEVSTPELDDVVRLHDDYGRHNRA